MEGETCTSAFFAGHPPNVHPDVDSGDTHARLEALSRRAQARWPDLPLSRSRFFAHLGRCAEHEVARAEALHVEDLWLVLAVVDEVPGAMQTFEDAVWPPLRRLLARRVARAGVPDDLDEVIQNLRVYALLGAPGQPPKILSYAGRAPLRRWFAVAAVRTLDRTRRGAAHTEPFDVDAPGPGLTAALDVQDVVLKAEAKQLLSDALRCAAGELERADRLMLRLHVNDGLTIDQLAVLHGVHRATAARRLERARRDLGRLTRRHLVRASALAPWEIESMIRVVRSSFRSIVGAYLLSTAGHPVVGDPSAGDGSAP